MDFRSFIFFLSLCFLSACDENSNFTTGVGIGGSGDGNGNGTPITVTPLPSQDPDPDDEIEYIIWSNGKVESICGNAKITMQLLHNQTEQPLDQGYGILINPSTKINPTNVSIEIKTENLTNESFTEYYNECISSVKLLDDEENEIKKHQQLSCPGNDISITYNPKEIKNYKFEFSVPYKDSKKIVSYTPIFSFSSNISTEERLTCDPLIYEINIEEY